MLRVPERKCGWPQSPLPRSGHQFSGKSPQLIVASSCPAIFYGDVLFLGVPGFGQTAMERGQRLSHAGRRPAVEKANHRNATLLRPRSKRPSRRAANKCDELQFASLLVLPPVFSTRG